MINRIIKKYIDNISKDDILNFGINNDIYLTDDELDYIYSEIKKNWMYLLNNPTLVISNIQNNISSNNGEKIIALYNEYYSKYKNYL